MKRPAQIRSGLLVALVAALAPAPAFAEPPVERTLVHAVADADRDRIFVRWLQVEGSVQRFSHYDVLRREASESALVPLNANPILGRSSLTPVVISPAATAESSKLSDIPMIRALGAIFRILIEVLR